MPGHRPDIEAALAAMPMKTGNNLVRSAGFLPAVLRDGETVQVILWANSDAGYGILTLTNQRLLFVMKTITKQHVLDYEFSRISTVEWSSKFLGGKLVIHVAGNRSEEFKVPDTINGAEVAKEVRERAARPVAPAAAPAPAAGPDPMEQLRQLGSLRDTGILTTAEFEAKKAEILGRI